MDPLALLNHRTAAPRSQANATPANPSPYDPTDPDRAAANAGGDRNSPRSSPRGSPKDTVNISSEARAASRSSAYTAGDKDFDQVKRDMRGLMDARLRLAGTTLDKNTKMTTVNNLFDDITDRRALFAVYGDETETFNTFEKKAAKWLELQLQKKSFAELPKNDQIIGLTNYLDQASAEEKASFEWIENRADAQAGLYGGLRGWQQFIKAHGGVETGDKAVDDLVSRLTLNKLMSWRSKTEHTETGTYARIKKDFDGLVDRGHAFSFTDGSKPGGLIGYLNKANKEQRAEFHALRHQTNTQAQVEAGSTKNWWQNTAKNGIGSNWWASSGGNRGSGSNWWASGGNRGVDKAISLYNAALRTRRV